MKRIIIFLILLTYLGMTACHRSSCPAYDKESGQLSIKNSKKTKTGLFPKNMR